MKYSLHLSSANDFFWETATENSTWKVVDISDETLARWEQASDDYYAMREEQWSLYRGAEPK
jgi:hypothetical protein